MTLLEVLNLLFIVTLTGCHEISVTMCSPLSHTNLHPVGVLIAIRQAGTPRVHHCGPKSASPPSSCHTP